MFTVSVLQRHLVARLPNSTHRGVAKLVLSAQLKPARYVDYKTSSTSVTNPKVLPTCVKARVVSAGEGDHNLSRLLDYLVVGNAVLAEDERAYHTHLVP